MSREKDCRLGFDAAERIQLSGEEVYGFGIQRLLAVAFDSFAEVLVVCYFRSSSRCGCFGPPAWGCQNRRNGYLNAGSLVYPILQPFPLALQLFQFGR